MGVMRRSCTPTCRSCGSCGSLRQPFFWTSDQGSKEDQQGQNNDGRSNRQRYLTSYQDTVQNDIKLTDTQSSYSSPPDMSKILKSSKTPIQQVSLIQSLHVQQHTQDQALSTQVSTAHYQKPQPWDAKRPYKTVDEKHRPVPVTFPEEAHITQQIPEDPLLSLKPLSAHPLDFTPMLKLTQAQLDILKINCDGFLWPEEEKLFIMVFANNKKVLVYTESK